MTSSPVSPFIGNVISNEDHVILILWTHGRWAWWRMLDLVVTPVHMHNRLGTQTLEFIDIEGPNNQAEIVSWYGLLEGVESIPVAWPRGIVVIEEGDFRRKLMQVLDRLQAQQFTTVHKTHVELFASHLSQHPLAHHASQ